MEGRIRRLLRRCTLIAHRRASIVFLALDIVPDRPIRLSTKLMKGRCQFQRGSIPL
jgi:hypothetical protein